jgi:ribonuclease G
MLVPEGFGVIVRTVAEGRDAKSLDTDLRLLLEKWRKIEKKLAGKPDKPMKVHEDVSIASSIIRDLFSSDYDRILVDHPRLYRNIKNYIQAVAPQMVPAVQQYQGKEHILKDTKLLRDIEEVFEERVELPSGGYLFIERTEAMHVIDVNSGRSGRGMNQ